MKDSNKEYQEDLSYEYCGEEPGPMIVTPVVPENPLPSTEDSPETKGMGYITNTNTPRTRRKVAIVGFAPSSMKDVKNVWDDPDFEVWGLNQLYVSFPGIVEKATRWFQIHHRHSYDQAVRDHLHYDWLARQTAFPIYMQDHNPGIPASVPLPKDLIINKFGRYFTNSISWEIALAILEGFEVIHIYGVDMAQDEEYVHQRPSCEFFLGWARGAGIKIYIPEKSDLLKTMWLYPFEEESTIRTKIDSRRDELRKRVNQLAMEEEYAKLEQKLTLRNIRDQRMHIIGALENMNYIEQSWMNAVRAQPEQKG